ncbi:MAG: TIGR03013 family XrtA/PEP-CTERM system glycosyltransferase, partial [Dissulfurispiraceae bacterium]
MSIRGLFLIIIDVLLALLSLYSAALIRLGYSEVTDKLFETSALFTAVIYVVAILFASHLMDTYDIDKNTRKREIFINTLLGVTASFFLLSITYYIYPGVMLGRGILLISLAIFTLIQFGWHVVFYLVGCNHPRFSRQVLVLGTGPLACQVGEFCSSHNRNFTLAGFAQCNCNSAIENEKRDENVVVPRDLIVGNADDLMAATLQAQADLIVVALSERRGVFPLRDVLRCKMNGIEVMDAPSFYELVNGKLMLEQITPSWIIFSSGFHRTIFFNLSKRYIDIILSTIGLLLTAPLFPIIALVIKLDSPGPVFFRQTRVGNREKLFKLYKFRTMRQDAEEQTGAIWAMKNDPRITRLGNFFRKSRIDEIPQLYNVLKGDMSFVGPRPERPEFVEKLKQIIPYYSKRHFIKPGLTGWAQVKYPYGASVEDAIEKLRYDLYYIKNIGHFLDTLIFFETIKV